MSTPFNKRAWGLGLKAVPNFEALQDEVIVYYEQHLDQLSQALARGFVVPAEAPAPEPPVEPALTFTVTAVTLLDPIAEKETDECFVGRIWNRSWRDGDIDRWLPKKQPATDAHTISTLAPSKGGWTFAEAAAKILGVGAGTDIALLGRLLIEHGYTMTLPQAEEMVEATERGGKTCIRTDGYWNFFFVETGDPEDPVSVGGVGRVGRAWYAGVRGLVRGGRWDAGRRFLLRNLKLDTLNL